MRCHECLGGNHNLCLTAQPEIVNYYGGFAEHVRAHWIWVIPLPDDPDTATARFLLCSGITVFSALLTFDIKPSHHVGIAGIGRLGHMGIKFANA